MKSGVFAVHCKVPAQGIFHLTFTKTKDAKTWEGGNNPYLTDEAAVHRIKGASPRLPRPELKSETQFTQNVPSFGHLLSCFSTCRIGYNTTNTAHSMSLHKTKRGVMTPEVSRSLRNSEAERPGQLLVTSLPLRVNSHLRRGPPRCPAMRPDVT